MVRSRTLSIKPHFIRIGLWVSELQDPQITALLPHEAMQSAVIMPQYILSVCLSVSLPVCMSVCLSVTFRYRDHIGWNSSKITFTWTTLPVLPEFLSLPKLRSVYATLLYIRHRKSLKQQKRHRMQQIVPFSAQISKKHLAQLPSSLPSGEEAHLRRSTLAPSTTPHWWVGRRMCYQQVASLTPAVHCWLST